MKGESLTYFTKLKGKRKAVTCSRSQSQLCDRNTTEVRLVHPSKSFSNYTILPSKSHFIGGVGERRWNQVTSGGEETSKLFSYSYYVNQEEKGIFSQKSACVTTLFICQSLCANHFMTLKTPTGINKGQFTFKGLQKRKLHYSSLNRQDLSFPNYPKPGVFLSVYTFPVLARRCTPSKNKNKKTTTKKHVM